MVARIIHELSSRQHETFQAVNCAALPDTLFESEVFGYERGAFTGAYERKPGRIELANHGTLFLDEVGDLSPLAQAKLLRVTEEHRVERLGGRHEHRSGLPPDLRDQPPARVAGRRRHVPRGPLSTASTPSRSGCPRCANGPSDIPVLADRFLARYCAAHGLPLDARQLRAGRRRPADGLSVARQHPRARDHRVARGALGARTASCAPKDLQFLHPVAPAPRAEASVLVPLRDVEREHIRRVLGAP